jgi:hypothetical protein
MFGLRTIQLDLISRILLKTCIALIVAFEAPFLQAEMARAQSPSPNSADNILVPAEGMLVDGKAPGIVTVDLGNAVVPADAQMELSVVPVVVSPTESYVVVVSVAAGDATEHSSRELGSFSFFPPPIAGERRPFLVDAPPHPVGQSRVRLAIRLVSVEPGQTLERSSLRIVGARLVR